MVWRRRSWTVPAMALVGVLASAGCGGESGYDVYMKGAKLEGEAERGPCGLQYSQPSQAAPLTGDQVQKCLELTEQAIELYDKAAQMGFDDPNFADVRKRAAERKERVESMLKMVRQMEREQRGIGPGPG